MNGLLNGHRYAKAAVDMAAYDILGKATGLRVADLLGGVASETAPSYYATGVGEPDEIARIAAEKAKEGYPRLQIKISGRPVDIDIAVLRKVWEVVRGKGVRPAADGKRGMPTRDALRLSRECQDIPLHHGTALQHHRGTCRHQAAGEPRHLYGRDRRGAGRRHLWHSHGIIWLRT